MQLVLRTVDVVTGADTLEDLHTLADFPVFMGSVEHARSEDLTADMSWAISKTSGLIQLKQLLPLEVLYQAQTTTSAVGPTWMAHHREFAAFIKKYSPTSVLELGGAHGILSVEFEKYSDVAWTVLEPNPAPVEGCKADFIKGFFDDAFRFEKPFEVLVHSHVFEHLYEPAKFMAQLGRFMQEGQMMIFSVPDMSVWLKRKYTNCINFEHTVFLTEPYIDYLLAKYGFRILEKSHVMDGHSIFYSTVRDSSVTEVQLPASLYAENKASYMDFVGYYETLVRELNEKVSDWQGQVYLFGAHIFAQYLIAFGLDTSRVKCILDNDQKKQGRRLYGTSLTVASPNILTGLSDVAVILKAGIYNNEIKSDIRVNINKYVTYFE